MASLNCRNLIWFIVLNMSLCLIVHSGYIYRPSISDEDFLSMMESNGLLNNKNDENSRINISPYLYDDNTIRQIINHHKTAKRSKLNLHTNLNLPRYLRTVD